MHRIGESPENVAAVVDLMHLPGKDKGESVAVFNYFLANREFLFFTSDELWTVIGECYCDRYAKILKPVCFRIELEFAPGMTEF